MRAVRVVSMMVLFTMLSACAHSVPSRAGYAPTVRQAAAAKARSEAQRLDLVLLSEIGEAAKKTLREIDMVYAELKLNTAAGRKITPQREEPLRAGLAPLIAELEARLAHWVGQLEADARYRAIAEEVARRRPLAGEPLPADAEAADMLYRVAQYRLKLGVLVEYAAREGAVK